jgi:hypothetical protein
MMRKALSIFRLAFMERSAYRVNFTGLSEINPPAVQMPIDNKRLRRSTA